MFLFEVRKLISWRFLGNECLMVDKSCILVKCTRRAYFLGSWRDNLQISGRSRVVKHLCMMWSQPQTPSIHVICTLTDYIHWFLCVFGFLDWFWNGKTSNNILFLFMLFYRGQPFKKVPNMSWIRPQDWWECTQDPSNLKPFDKCHASEPLGSSKDVLWLSHDQKMCFHYSNSVSLSSFC
jgi:hypothetical protein